MNNRALSLSLLMAALAVYFVYSYVDSLETEQKKRFGTEVLVLKAKKDIKEMDTLNETMVELESIPKKFLEPAAISFEDKENTKEHAKSIKGLTGQVAIVPIKKGEQITFNKLTEPSLRTGLSPQITPGKRAVAIPVNEVSGVAKLVKPGDRVDVVAVIDAGGGKENRVVKTLIQDIVVLAVGRNVTNNVARLVEPDPFGGKDKIKNLSEDASFTSVTVEVDPVQANALILVTSNGDNMLNLSLRNNDDTDRQQVEPMRVVDILGGDAIQRGVAGRR